MTEARKRIVIVGGGSNAWTPTIVRDLLLTESIAGSTFVLYDINQEAADLMAVFLRKLATRLDVPGRFVPTSNRRQAFRAADYFIITISTGGLRAMAHDIAIPEEYGIYHTVGDTAGPGGWARALRNIPVFQDLAEGINRFAPGAMVLNYTNPMAVLTDVLARTCSGPVVGLCHGLFENLRFLTAFYGLESEQELSVGYGGLNHFFWMNRISARGRDLLADLRGKVRRRGFTALLRQAYRDRPGYSSSRELATALFNETGVMPYLGDRHTCEFFPCYITSRAAMHSYALERTSVAERWKEFRQRDRRLRGMIRGQIPDEFFQRSRETAADIIGAHASGKPFIDVGNMANLGQIGNLPRGVVVETAVRVDGNGFSPILFGDLPGPVAGLVEPVARAYEATVRACLERDRELALQALRLDPVCSHLTGDEVREMGIRLIGAHRAFTAGMFD